MHAFCSIYITLFVKFDIFYEYSFISVQNSIQFCYYYAGNNSHYVHAYFCNLKLNITKVYFKSDKYELIVCIMFCCVLRIMRTSLFALNVQYIKYYVIVYASE